MADKLGASISLAEVQEAIGQLQNVKSPGQDGFVVEFYKAYSNLLTPTAHILTNDVRSPSGLTAQTGMPPLPPPICSSYRALGHLASRGGKSGCDKISSHEIS